MSRVWILLLLAAGAVWAQQRGPIEPRQPTAPPKQEPREATLRADTNLVLIPVTVTDSFNRPVVGLEKENFRVFDEKAEQAITHFGMADDPVCVGFVFDTSGSMGEGMQQARRAARTFFRVGEPDDEYFLVEFDSRARLAVPLTNTTAEIENELLFTKSGGQTALFDAVYLALREMRKSTKSKRALILISDGGDNNSRYTFTEVQNMLREADTLIYTVGAGDIQFTSQLLADIARQTGGLFLRARGTDYEEVARKIIIDLRNRYVIGYTPSNLERNGKYRKVDVKLIPPRGLPKLKLSWRTGYYAQ